LSRRPGGHRLPRSGPCLHRRLRTPGGGRAGGQGQQRIRLDRSRWEDRPVGGLRRSRRGAQSRGAGRV